jgi:hypothetical protein
VTGLTSDGLLGEQWAWPCQTQIPRHLYHFPVVVTALRGFTQPQTLAQCNVLSGERSDESKASEAKTLEDVQRHLGCVTSAEQGRGREEQEADDHAFRTSAGQAA